MELFEMMRKFKRTAEGYISTKRAFFLVTFVLGLLLYLGPSIFRWLRQKTPIMIDPCIGSVAQNLDALYRDSLIYDASIRRSYESEEDLFLPYIGNGELGLPLGEDASLYIFHHRALSLSTDINPLVEVEMLGLSSQSAIGVRYATGMAYKFQCFRQRRNTLEVHYEYFAHRLVPSLLIQNIRIKNPLSEDITALLRQKPPKTEYESQKLRLPENKKEYKLLSGKLAIPLTKKIVVVVLALPVFPDSLSIEAKSSKNIQLISSLQYSAAVDPEHYKHHLTILEERVKGDLKKAFEQLDSLKNNHIQGWKQLWSTGFSISQSKAQDAVNGDTINATVYYMLSNSKTHPNTAEVQAQLSYPDQCYRGIHTMQAHTLWSKLNSITEINKIVHLWMLTLEKQGCQTLLKAGAEGVMQAMVLSFGALTFSNHHLEFGMHPKDLHRDYHFRRISYGNATHLNISVVVGPDNKALLYVAVDRSDRDYYACDGGCLDAPVQLGSTPVQFPVKLTEPITPVLYITFDKRHMEELKHTLHVKEVAEAPPHEHHIIALHRHGHQLGGLPALFWVSLAFLIIVFHLFLAKLVYNEYCGGQEKTRGRYIV